MKRKLLTAIALFALCMITLVVAVNSGRAQRNEFESPHLPQAKATKPSVQPRLNRSSPKKSPAVAPSKVAQIQKPPNLSQPRSEPLPTDCTIRPEVNPNRAAQAQRIAIARKTTLAVERFRRLEPSDSSESSASQAGEKSAITRPTPSYMPREEIVLIDPTNYGDRFLLDVNGNPANQRPIIVLHETVASADSTLNFFRTPHPRDEDQASYHTLIRRNGTITYMVPGDKRAYGAGNSIFIGDQGPEAVKTHTRFPPSVNNFAYHISLETPGDGINNAASHSGYTEAQYQSLAWLVAKTGVADNRITTHKAVDRSQSRMDPRSFSFPRFFQLLQTYTKTTEIPLRCTVPAQLMQSKVPTQQASAKGSSSR